MKIIARQVNASCRVDHISGIYRRSCDLFVLPVNPAGETMVHRLHKIELFISGISVIMNIPRGAISHFQLFTKYDILNKICSERHCINLSKGEKMKKTLLSIMLFASISVSLTGCYTMRVQVGNGGKNETHVSKRQWYALYGLVRAMQENVNVAEMAGGADDYTVSMSTTTADYFISVPLSIFTIGTRTVTVSK